MTLAIAEEKGFIKRVKVSDFGICKSSNCGIIEYITINKHGNIIGILKEPAFSAMDGGDNVMIYSKAKDQWATIIKIDVRENNAPKKVTVRLNTDGITATEPHPNPTGWNDHCKCENCIKQQDIASKLRTFIIEGQGDLLTRKLGGIPGTIHTATLLDSGKICFP